jgi:hypothetical protein
MKLEFEMLNLRMISYFLDLEIKQEKLRIFASQGAYGQRILQKFGIKDCNPVTILMEFSVKLSKLKGGDT